MSFPPSSLIFCATICRRSLSNLFAGALAVDCRCHTHFCDGRARASLSTSFPVTDSDAALFLFPALAPGHSTGRRAAADVGASGLLPARAETAPALFGGWLRPTPRRGQERGPEGRGLIARSRSVGGVVEAPPVEWPSGVIVFVRGRIGRDLSSLVGQSVALPRNKATAYRSIALIPCRRGPWRSGNATYRRSLKDDTRAAGEPKIWNR